MQAAFRKLVYSQVVTSQKSTDIETCLKENVEMKKANKFYLYVILHA